jgi:hypothetical protein
MIISVIGGVSIFLFTGGFERSNGVMYLQLLSRYKQSATATAWVTSLFSSLRLAMGNISFLHTETHFSIVFL